MPAAAAPAKVGEEAQKRVKIESSDGRIFEVPLKVAKLFTKFNTLLEDLGDEDDKPLPARNVTGQILEKVIQWCMKHPDDDETEHRSNDTSTFDKQFMAVNLAAFLEILLAANYLNIKGLLTLGCKTMYSMINGISAEEIRALLRIRERRDDPTGERLVRGMIHGLFSRL